MKRTLLATILVVAIISRPAPAEPPLFLARTDCPGLTYRNVSGDAAQLAILEQNGQGLALLDFDQDGWIDLFVTNGGRLDEWRRNRHPGCRLYRNLGNWRFDDVTANAGVAGQAWGTGAAAADYDDDGDVDLYVMNWGPNVLYRNNGDGTFSDVTAMAGFGDPGVGRGTAVGDYNNDGALDFYVVNADGTNILYRNEIGTRNNWVKLRFEGSESNRDGIGVRVQIYTDQWSQIAEVSGGSGYLGGNGKELVCGLGQLTEVKRITVIWPGGAVQSFKDVAVNQTLIVREPG